MQSRGIREDAYLQEAQNKDLNPLNLKILPPRCSKSKLQANKSTRRQMEEKERSNLKKTHLKTLEITNPRERNTPYLFAAAKELKGSLMRVGEN